MIWRKGITQTFSADGALVADERWQILRFANGAVQLDAEVTRLAPFAEPRMESLSVELAPGARPNELGEPLRALSLHESRGRREGRVNVVDARAYFCWQHGQKTDRIERVWPDEAEVMYASSLFATAIVWRSQLVPGQSRAFTSAALDPVSFRPNFGNAVLTRLEDEERETRFGVKRLAHYEFAMPIPGLPQREGWWCDEDGIVFDALAGDGTRTLLTAVNFR